MYFFYFLRQGRAEISHQGKYLKFENMKLSHSIFISWNSIYLCIRDRAFNWQSAFWNNVVTCFSKNSLLSVSMRNSVTVFSESLHKKMKFSVKKFFSKFDQIRSFLWIWTIYWKTPHGKLHFLCSQLFL